MEVTGKDWKAGMYVSLRYMISQCDLLLRKEEWFKSQGKTDLKEKK